MAKIIPFKTLLLSEDMTCPMLVIGTVGQHMWLVEVYKWGYDHPDTFRINMVSNGVEALTISPKHPAFQKHRKFGGLPPKYLPLLPFEEVLSNTDYLMAEMMIIIADAYANSYDLLSADEFDAYHVSKILHFTERAAWYLAQANVQVDFMHEGMGWYTIKFEMFKDVQPADVNDKVHSLLWNELLDEVKKKMPQAIRNFAEMGS